MKIVKNKLFYLNILSIVIPIAAQNLISFGVNMSDTVMLGIADKTGILLAAASLANQPFFVLSLFIFGLSGAGSVLAAQYWGKGDICLIRIIISMIVKISAIVSLGSTVLILTFPKQIMSLFTANPEIIAAGAEYLGIIGYTYFIFGISSALICSLRSVEIVRISVAVNLASFIINATLNYVLIFGNFGLPALGIKGAAVATLCARIIELIIILLYLFLIDKRLGFGVKDILLFDKTLFGDLVKHGSPVVINEVMWSLGIAAQAAILGHIDYSSGDPVAANSICGIVQQLATIVVFGIANAAAVLIGKSVGEGNKDETLIKADTFKLIAFLFGIMACVIIFLLRDVAVVFYDFSDETKNLAKDMLIVVAVNVIFISLSATYIVGILRGAGDTRFCLIIELVFLWLASVPLAAGAAFLLHSPVPLVLTLMRADEPLKAFVCTFRTRGTKWIKNVTRNY